MPCNQNAAREDSSSAATPPIAGPAMEARRNRPPYSDAALPRLLALNVADTNTCMATIVMAMAAPVRQRDRMSVLMSCDTAPKTEPSVMRNMPRAHPALDPTFPTITPDGMLAAAC